MSQLAKAKQVETPEGIIIGVKPCNYGVKLQETSESAAICASAAVDWFSATTVKEMVGSDWWKLFCRYRQKYPLLVQDWHHQGGYKGQQCIGIYWGFSEKYGYLLRGTGSVAEELTGYIFLAGQSDFRVTRLDLRVDVLLNEKDDKVASGIYYANKESKRPKFKLVKAPEGEGETVYIGSAQSDTSGRIYDKGAERHELVGSKWRYEVVFRKPTADVVFVELWKAFTIDGIAEQIIDQVGSWLDSRGVIAPFGFNEAIVPVVVKEKTPYESKLEWLERSVQKTVCLLVEAGFKEQVLQALGLEVKSYK